MSKAGSEIRSEKGGESPQARISKELGLFIESKSSTFTCGGSIPITTPFSLRWDTNTSDTTAGAVAKLNFPVNDQNKGDKAALATLIRDCQPASFGFHGEEVLDENYRRATKMDRSALSIDFCPYELGIIDTITQVLLPNAADGIGAGLKGVKAELYKLNIYAAPSGFFKAHVDTPRSETQFGSLVVSLPCRYEGGQLLVRHAGHVVTYDWGTSSGRESSIQWGAFYSDCEHEVLEVTGGHRITMTYNLYFNSSDEILAHPVPALDVKTLPLYHEIQSALAEPSFMPKGGYLGVTCQFAYAHSTPQGSSLLPAALKGSDMAVYTIFRSLCLSVSVRPRLELRYDEAEYFLRYGVDEELASRYEQAAEELSWIGNKLHSTIVTHVGGYDNERWALDQFPGSWLNVNWLTEAPSEANQEIGLVHLTYGNEPGVNHYYTHAVLLVTVPPAPERLASQK